MQVYEILRQRFSGFTNLPEDEWLKFKKLTKVQNIAKGELLVRVGDKALPACFILKGILKSYYVGENGKECVRSFASEGDFISPLGSGLQGARSNLAISAIEASQLIVLSFTDWRTLLKESAVWEPIHRQLAETFYVARENHAFDLLTAPAIERYRRFLDRFPEIAPRVSQKDIASYIGITGVALSRLIAKV